MTRIGFLPNEKRLFEINEIMNMENIIVEGIFSHLSKADEKNKYAEYQLKVLLELFQKKQLHPNLFAILSALPIRITSSPLWMFSIPSRSAIH